MLRNDELPGRPGPQVRHAILAALAVNAELLPARVEREPAIEAAQMQWSTTSVGAWVLNVSASFYMGGVVPAGVLWTHGSDLHSLESSALCCLDCHLDSACICARLAAPYTGYRPGDASSPFPSQVTSRRSTPS